MTIIEILDGLAELGRLRLERERQEQGAQPVTQEATPPKRPAPKRGRKSAQTATVSQCQTNAI
jgi:hypothetical protein